MIREVYVGSGGTGRGKGGPSRALTHPETNQPLPAKPLGGPEMNVEPGKDPRVALSLALLAGTYQAAGSYARAEPLLGRALGIVPPPKSSNVWQQASKA